MLRKNPEDRYKDAQALIDDLDLDDSYFVVKTPTSKDVRKKKKGYLLTAHTTKSQY